MTELPTFCGLPSGAREHACAESCGLSCWYPDSWKAVFSEGSKYHHGTFMEPEVMI